MLCCWTKTLLALPAGQAPPAHLACAAERCVLNRCRRRDGCGGEVRDDAERRLDELVRAAAVEPPDSAELTSLILSRLEAAGLLPDIAVARAQRGGRP